MNNNAQNEDRVIYKRWLEGKNYYEKLGIPVMASEREIREARNKLVKLFNTDQPNNIYASTSFMQHLNKIYAILSVPSEREKYDKASGINKPNQTASELKAEKSLLKFEEKQIKTQLREFEEEKENLTKNRPIKQPEKIVEVRILIIIKTIKTLEAKE